MVVQKALSVIRSTGILSIRIHVLNLSFGADPAVGSCGETAEAIETELLDEVADADFWVVPGAAPVEGWYSMPSHPPLHVTKLKVSLLLRSMM